MPIGRLSVGAGIVERGVIGAAAVPHGVIRLERQCMLGLPATAGFEAGPFWRGQMVVSGAGGLWPSDECGSTVLYNEDWPHSAVGISVKSKPAGRRDLVHRLGGRLVVDKWSSSISSFAPASRAAVFL